MTSTLEQDDHNIGTKDVNPELIREGHNTNVRRVRKSQHSLSDIPKSELTPKVQSVMSLLMNEVDRLKEELSASKEKIVRLENIADEDTLVPVLNRRGFIRELDRVIAYSKRYKTKTSIMYIDVDRFKSINDTYGHKVGDLALRHIGLFLTNKVRQSDIVARLGGDEFAIILQNVGYKAATIKARQLEEHIKNMPCICDQLSITLSLSIGVAELLGTDTSVELMDRADQAMYSLRQQRRPK